MNHHNALPQSQEVKKSVLYTLTTFAKKHSIPIDHVKAAIEKSEATAYTKRGRSNRLVNCYIEEELLSCFTLLPKEGSQGVLIDQNGIAYRTLGSFMTKHGITSGGFSRQVVHSGMSSIVGLDRRNNKRSFYPIKLLSELRHIDLEDTSGVQPIKNYYYAYAEEIALGVEKCSIKALADAYDINPQAISEKVSYYDINASLAGNKALRREVYRRIVADAEDQIKEIIRDEVYRITNYLTMDEKEVLLREANQKTISHFRTSLPRDIEEARMKINTIIFTLICPEEEEFTS